MVFAFFLLLCATALAAGDEGQQKKIDLPRGTRLEFLGVTRGRRHEPPQYEHRFGINRIFTTNDALVAWIKASHPVTEYPTYELLVSDAANTACVPVEKASASHIAEGVDVQGFILKAYPRWDPETILRARPYNGTPAEGSFTFSNPPTSEPVPAWRPTSLPAESSDGDFRVQLSQVTTRVRLPRQAGAPEPPKDPSRECVRIQFAFWQNGRPAAQWEPRSLQVADPSGNFIQPLLSRYPLGGVFDYPKPGQVWTRETDGYYFRPGLWPRDTWKLRMEFTRSANAIFADTEIATFSKVDVLMGTQADFEQEWSWDQRNTNLTFAAADASGVKLKLLSPLIIPDRDQPDQKHLFLIIYTDPNPVPAGLHLTLLGATDEAGREVAGFGERGVWAGHFSFESGVAKDVKKLNVKFALHKSRFADFIVDP